MHLFKVVLTALISFLIFFSYLTLAIEPDISLAITKMVGVSGFIVILIAVLQFSSDHCDAKSSLQTQHSGKKELSAGFIIAFAILMRLMFLFHTPTLSDDIYRYCLDGAMLANGQNPYSYTPLELLEAMQRQETFRNESEIIFPNSPSQLCERGLGGEVNGQVIKNPFLNPSEAMTDLQWKYPSLFSQSDVGIEYDHEGLERIREIYPEISTLLPLINHPELATIYPPAAQITFAIGNFADSALNFNESFTGIKTVLIIMDTLSCLFIIRILKKMKLPACHATIYAWHPLPVLEIAKSGHIDGAAIFFL
ncbi:membrane hypothetical protein [Desulfamplus magnetovallimortis]|uniref:Uncharacterized protein n=1 Tax=Desulfamplus magnetovallimortis TaxID=1246637 RepID=A0A1W1H5D7_9BACT|nr:hypothetical protein [Desulfamplus magnetovallimortis]SLM27701.1 membrane hypothetical protein [Desulfamplus magnetovallimortis]